jgi:hypothetical protein
MSKVVFENQILLNKLSLKRNWNTNYVIGLLYSIKLTFNKSTSLHDWELPQSRPDLDEKRH